MKRLTLPHEHGGALTLVGAALAAGLVAPEPGVAVAIEVVLLLSFLARGPLERKAPPRPWDRRALAVAAVLGALGLLFAWQARPAAAAVATAGALALPAAALLARDRRWLHGAGFELLAMFGLGASGGLAAWSGGLAPARAVALAILVGAHAAASVPLVRGQVRRRERPLVPVAAGLVAGAAVALVLLGRPLVLAGLVPRALDTMRGALVGTEGRSDPRAIGVRETALLAVVALAAALTV